MAMAEQELDYSSDDEVHRLKNPFVIIIGSDDYSFYRNKYKLKMDDLDGVKTDVYTMIRLFNDIYGYNDIKIIYPIPSNYDNESSYNKEIYNKLEKYQKHFALFKQKFDSHAILHNPDHLLDYLCKIRNNKIDNDERKNSESNDGLIFYYSGHGIRNCILLPNGYKLQINKIIDIFNGKNCIQLRDKPKIMIYDCCRGNDIGMTHLNDENNNNNKTKGSHISNRYHSYSGFAQIFANYENFAINDCDNGSFLTKSFFKVLENPVKIENKSLNGIIRMIRRLTKQNSGFGNSAYGCSAQIVDFHETLEYRVYFDSANKNTQFPLKSAKTIAQQSSTNIQSNKKNEEKYDNNNNKINCNNDENDRKEYKCTFTNLDGNGRLGPTTLGNYYKGQCHENDVYLDKNGMQIWTVPYSGYYNIIAYGAKGGNSICKRKNNNKQNKQLFGGNGAIVGGIIKLNKNDKLKLLIGQMGMSCIFDNIGGSGGGGGATFVIKRKKKQQIIPLFIAAGGNGACLAGWWHVNGIKGLAIQAESRNDENNKYGGYISNGHAARGASFKNDDKNNIFESFKDENNNNMDYNECNGFSFMDGGKGGSCEWCSADGGFGGGGASGDSEGGAGGGYIGGLVARHQEYYLDYSFYGALSYNCCKDDKYKIMKSGKNNGHGKVEIEYKGNKL